MAGKQQHPFKPFKAHTSKHRRKCAECPRCIEQGEKCAKRGGLYYCAMCNERLGLGVDLTDLTDSETETPA